MPAKHKSQYSIVKNYGVMWRRDRVFWKISSVYGSLVRRRSGREIDFGKQIGIYVLYDEKRSPVYVGQTGQKKARLFHRMKAHTRDGLSLRWQYFSWFGLLEVNKDGSLRKQDNAGKKVHTSLGHALDEIEGVLIAATEPAFNKQGAKFRGIALYRQVLSREAEDVSLSELRLRLARIENRIVELDD